MDEWIGSNGRNKKLMPTLPVLLFTRDNSPQLERESKQVGVAEPGRQIIRLLFDEPQKLKRIWLVFEETEMQPTQEFVLRWSPDHGRSFREIIRQQWNFGPPGTVREIDDYTVELGGVTVLELRIVPDKNDGDARITHKFTGGLIRQVPPRPWTKE
jgi:hypothetical protein